MTNENMPKEYLGQYIKDIDPSPMKSFLKLDAGTILIQDVGGLQVYFQLEDDYVFNFLGKTHPMEMLLGSAIDGRAMRLPDSQKFCLPQHVRIPTLMELEWYNRQKTV